ncbi:hypothetical protein COCON_G00154460 [Conger conger]|uniref:Arrestin C-terminal-like domain-containing protein n=1 Tax=Conger conger TaxID=82655 RepID=A0A9Q1HU66_CONCO|nr:hypothetical protein COCON_G00154460 [Conger conger]
MLSSTVKSLSISYDPINEQNTFSNGDTISGRLMLELTKEAEINSLSVKVKGKADVHWTEKQGDRHESYNAKEDYFKLEHFIYRKAKNDGGQKDRLVDHMGETYGKAIPAGKHVYPFSFRIPDGKMPSSYKGIHGKVLYTVTGKLDRSMRMDQKETVVFNFLSRVDMHNPVNMLPQSGMENKKMKLFTKGSANMKVSINKKGYMPGESIMITANIENDSSRDLVPKFSLDREESFYARSHQKQFNKRILKEEGEAIPSKSHQTNNYMVKIPSDVMVSITHCRIIKVLYHLKVYLDVPYASDPEIVFPLIIFPPTKGYSPMPPPVGKRTKIDYLFIKAKGKAKALWSETHGKVVVVYYDVEKYFTLKNYIIQDQKAEGQDYQTLLSGNGETYSNVVGPGVHEYPFTFQIPEGNMPSSFKGSCGKIVYTLEAKLSRSMKLPCKTKTKFIFHSKTDPYIPQLLEPQFAMKEEKMKVFTSGNVTMNIKTERMGYLQGEGLKVTAEIENNSSRSIVPKFCLYQKQSFFVQDNRRVHTHNILKEAGEPISVSTRQKVTKVLSIPHDVSPTILNCKVVHVEYRLKLYLDIPFAKDPEIKLPVVILPADSAFAKMVQTWPPS